MAPSEVSARLRTIADKIDRSAKPDRMRVAAEVSQVVEAVAGGKPLDNRYDGALQVLDDMIKRMKDDRLPQDEIGTIADDLQKLVLDVLRRYQ